jgi:hypothetical protein
VSRFHESAYLLAAEGFAAAAKVRGPNAAVALGDLNRLAPALFELARSNAEAFLFNIIVYAVCRLAIVATALIRYPDSFLHSSNAFIRLDRHLLNGYVAMFPASK